MIPDQYRSIAELVIDGNIGPSNTAQSSHIHLQGGDGAEEFREYFVEFKDDNILLVVAESDWVVWQN